MQEIYIRGYEKPEVFLVLRNPRDGRLLLKSVARVVNGEIRLRGYAEQLSEADRADLNRTIRRELMRRNAHDDDTRKRMSQIFDAFISQLKDCVDEIDTTEEHDALLHGLLDLRTVVSNRLAIHAREKT